MRANSLWRAVSEKADHAPNEEAKPLKKSVCFLRGGFLQFRCVSEAAADKNTDPDLQGKAPRSLNIRGVRQGTAAVFGILADTRIGLFGIPATFAPENPTPAVASL